MTTLRDTEQDAPPQFPTTPPPSPWSAPRPDGPLAAALRLAETQRAAGAVPGEAPPPSPPEAFEEDIEALAREAKSRDDAREALAIALEWPEEDTVRPTSSRRRWIGWIALAGAILLAAVAAAIAVSMAPEESLQAPLPSSTDEGLRLERQLSSPAGAPGREAAS